VATDPRARGRLPWLLLALAFGSMVATRVPPVAAQGPQVVGDSVHMSLRPLRILIDPLANDQHPQDRAMRVTSVSAPQLGAVGMAKPDGSLMPGMANPDGTVTLVITQQDLDLEPGRTKVHFSYTVSDGTASATGQVCVGVCAVFFDPPVCRLDVVAPNPVVGQQRTLDPLANDDGDGLELVAWSQPLGNLVRGTGNLLLYTGTQAGPDGFDYWVQDASGRPGSASVSMTVDPPPPGPVATAVIQHNCIGLNCSFDGRGSAPPPAEVQSYQWGFGDGATKTGSWVTHSYALPGTYPVTLTVVPWQGQPGSTTVPIVVNQVPASYNFVWRCYDRSHTNTAECGCSISHPTCNCDLRCWFQIIGSAPSGSIARWIWGNGTVTGPGPFLDLAFEYRNYGSTGPGIYDVTLEVTPPGGQTQSRTNHVEAFYLQPQLSLSTACEERDCTISATGELSRAELDHWEFGDGTTAPAPGPSVTHTYPDHRPSTARLHHRDIWQRPFLTETGVDPGADFHLEIGTVNLDLALTKRVLFRRPMTEPVVIARSLTQAGSGAGEVRVRDVDALGFNITVQEPGATTLDPTLTGSETVSYLAVEDGHWELSDGTLVEAHHSRPNTLNENDSYCGKVGTRNNINPWARNFFHIPFTAPPVVFVDQSPVFAPVSPRFRALRLRAVTSRWFDCAIEREEADPPSTGATNAAWVAISAPASQSPRIWRGTDGQDRRVDWGSTTPGITDEWAFLAFTQAFDAPPAVVGALASYLDRDAAHLRQREASLTGFALRVEEDQTWDQETIHAAEAVSYLAVEGADLLSASGDVDLAPYPLQTRGDYARTNRWTPVEILVLENDPNLQGGEEVRVKLTPPPLDVPPQHGFAHCTPPDPSAAGAHLDRYCTRMRYSPNTTYLGSDTFSYRVRGRVGEAGPGLVTIDVVDRPATELLVEPFVPQLGLRGWVVKRQTNVGTADWHVDSDGVVRQTGDMQPPSGNVNKPGTYLVWQGGGGWTDQEIRLTLGTDDPKGDVGVMFRYNDPNNFYRVSWDLETGRGQIVRRQNGVYTLLAEGPQYFFLGYGNPIRISVVGSLIQVAVEHDKLEVPVYPLVVDDPDGLAAGSVALYASRNEGFFADDVVVTGIW
jgi:PKD repeat protein